MSANLRAFLYLVRWAEGTSDENGYRALYGHRKDSPKLFTGWDDHPRQAFQTPWGWTSAAGAYQFMAVVPGKTATNTWERAKAALNLADFSPDNQDKAAIWLIQQRRALEDVERGDLKSALEKCSFEWASLPPSRYGQPVRSYDSCEVIFERAGGTLMQPAKMVEAAGTPQPPAAPHFPSTESAPGLPEEKMPLPAAAIAALGVELIKLLPFARKPENQAAVEKIGPQLVALAKEAAGPSVANEQAAVEIVQKNPQVQQAFVAKAVANWGDIEPALRFEEESRDRAATRARSDDSINSATPLLIYGALGGSLLVFLTLTTLLVLQTVLTPDARPMGELVALFITVCGTVIGFATAIYMYRFGSSAGSKASGDAVRAIAEHRR